MADRTFVTVRRCDSRRISTAKTAFEYVIVRGDALTDGRDRQIDPTSPFAPTADALHGARSTCARASRHRLRAAREYTVLPCADGYSP
jgi:hypothetical protein